MSSIADLLRLYAQQFEDQHAPQNMTIALREASSLIEKQFEALKAANKEIERLQLKDKAREKASQRLARADLGDQND